ncbi:MAG TPA: GNAT family N-acetyltransferase [Gaiellaceae bacterium]|nr:GNAT family N-acetyltransferase [Gaiellaceae bacterium]
MTVRVVEVVEATDRGRAIASLTLAFSADSMMRWGWPDAESYASYWPQLADAFGGRAFEHGSAHSVEDCLGVALWLPPGIEPDGETVMVVMRDSMDDQTFADVNGLFEQMDKLHPRDEHWYLPLMGVDPIAQGRGLGSALLQHVLEACDRDRLPAYLEATSPRSRNLYERHGFAVVDTIQAGTSPPMWAMLREPAS